MGQSIRKNAITFSSILKNGSNGSAPRPKEETIDDKFNNLNKQYTALNNQYNALKKDYDGFKQKYESTAEKIDNKLVDYRQSEKPAWEAEQAGKDKLRAYGGFKLKANCNKKWWGLLVKQSSCSWGRNLLYSCNFQ